ncbi:hypothetical protein JS756_12610 [Streptomyces actuosus]|uniref:Uncharacterized protein n=1 Tax=Streptomyces actuosus TaxID=1885 RepID=A0ABS2VPA0_STRAS|nr:hypothetical protein [Streptomyces actuosus]MBN0044934.1 hypothetical protein [Streptomyces actuosus]
MLMDPENTLFVRGTRPVLLPAAAPIHDALPLPAAPDGTVTVCGGWSIVPRLTLCVVDDPADHGIVVPALAAPVLDPTQGADAPGEQADWCTDSERAGGALVLSVDRMPDVLDPTALLGSGTARGGFVRAVV